MKNITTNNSYSGQLDRPAFLVGITGYMDLTGSQITMLQDRIKTILWFLKLGGMKKNPNPNTKDKLLYESMAELLSPISKTDDKEEKRNRRFYERVLKKWPGLGNTPIVIMTNLAPGTDTAVAKVALKKDFQEAGFLVRAPLPFPNDLYRNASTFYREKNEKPLPGNEDRQNDYDNVIDAIGRENTFAVQLNTESFDWNSKHGDLQERYKKDLKDKSQRYRRYYAAGEYLAVYSHLLIAVWNGKYEESVCGTSSVVEARLAGPKTDILPTTSHLAHPHGGPVLHLLVNRPKESEAPYSEKEASGNDTLPQLRFLHPYGSVEERKRGQIIAPKQHKDLKRQRDRLGLFFRVARNLDRFNAREFSTTDESCKREFKKRLSCSEHNDIVNKLDAANCSFARDLRCLSSLRRKVSDNSMNFTSQANRTLWRIFCLTYLAAICIHIYAHWHPQEQKHESNHANTEEHYTSIAGDPKHHNMTESSGQGHEVSRVRLGAGGMTILLAIVAFIYFIHRKSKQFDEQAHDERSLSEGLRVQFYWNLAGLGRSVPANYMKRQHTELDWIRAAIRSVSFPYERWWEDFRKLENEVKLKIMRSVCYSWIKEQKDYFKKKFKQHKCSLHFWHKLGFTAALGGLFTILIWWIGSLSGDKEHFTNLFDQHGFLLSACCFLIAVVWSVILRFINRDISDDDEEYPLFNKAVDSLVPTVQIPGKFPVSNKRRLLWAIYNLAAHLPLALSVSIAALFVSISLANIFSYYWPESENLVIIFAGILLVTGAMAVAWAEKNLYSELAYQYSTMGSLFKHAHLKMEAHIKELDSLLRSETLEQKSVDEIICKIQKFLYDLGKEALAENADWLLLHRARPLEPVIPG